MLQNFSYLFISLFEFIVANLIQKMEKQIKSGFFL